MVETSLNPDKRGAIGEAIVFGGRRPPRPVSNAVEDFAKTEYKIAEEVPIKTSTCGKPYLRLITEDGKELTTRPDGLIKAEWVPETRKDEIDYGPRGNLTRKSRHELRDEEARFPIEVKTGEYAELERDQSEVLRGVSESQSNVHPIVIEIGIGGLPESYEIELSFL